MGNSGMVDPHVVASRLSVLEGYRARLEAFRELSREEFVADEDSHLLAERLLHLSCECVLDLAQHVISDLGFRQPEDYKDTMQVLLEEGILDQELASHLKEWMGFRNVLVRLYLAIDHGKCWQAIQDDLGQLEAFAVRMERFLDV